MLCVLAGSVSHNASGFTAAEIFSVGIAFEEMYHIFFLGSEVNFVFYWRKSFKLFWT